MATTETPLKWLPVNQLSLSRFNARRVRPESAVERLAERIKG